MRKGVVIVLLYGLLAVPSYAADIIKQYISEAKVVGSGRLTYLLWDAYDATLYAPEGNWDQNQPFALTLHYLRSINGKDIAERSIEEIRKQGFNDEKKLAAWHSQMRAIFPDVENGTTLTGIYMPYQPTRFYQGEKEIGVVRDPEFGKWFFNIWLADKTSEPLLRRKLLGL